MNAPLTLKRVLVRTRLLEVPVFRAKRWPLYNRLRFGVRTGRYIPEIIHVETTNACNARCFGCPRDKMERPVGIMPREISDKIVADLQPIGGLGLQFVMHLLGEPLVDPLLFERIRQIKARLARARVHLNTNGSLLDAERGREMLDCGLDSITISIDGTSPATYEHMRAGLRYAATVENARRFLSLRRTLARRRPHVTMQMVVDDSNRHEVGEFVRTWKGLADGVFIKAMLDFLVQGTSTKTATLSERQLRRCFQPVSLMAIYHDGRVGLCCWDYDHIAGLGSIRDAHLLDIFNDEQHERVRRAMMAMDCRDIVPCNRCSQIYGHDMDSVYRGSIASSR